MPIYSKHAVVGVDCFYREIHVGDCIQDLDGRRYTIDQFGRCKPLDGGNVIPLRNVKEASVIGSADPVEKTVPATEQPAPETPVAAPEPSEEIGHLRQEPRPQVSDKTRDDMSKGRNRSGAVQIYNIIRGKGYMINGADARGILEDAGIKTFGDSGKRGCIAREDYARALEVLGAWHEAHRDNPECPAPDRKRGSYRGNNSNHRPNLSGFVSFNNLARSLKVKAHELRQAANEGGFEIVRLGAKNRNDGLRKEDEERFRDYFARIAQPLISDDLHRPILGTNDPAKVWSKFDAFLILEDQDMVDELRRRGWTVSCQKHIEL